MLSGTGHLQQWAFVMTMIKDKEPFDCQLFLHGISHIVDYTMRKTTVLIP